ncbi:arylamine N-acetyltransferase [soil metagenome]
MNEYLERINVRRGDAAPDLQTLRSLQRQHLLNVPFENLDIHWKRPIVLDTKAIYSKIVSERRGGFCYELNALFNELLQVLGFQTYLVSARVFGDENGFGPEFEHAAIIVNIGDDEYLADVGFGDFTTEPLRVTFDLMQIDPAGTFVIRRYDDDYLEVAKHVGDEWKSQYIFSTRARELSEFIEMCDFQQYSPDSHFTHGKICSILTEDGRKTLTDKRLIISSSGTRHELEVDAEENFNELLMSEFNIAGPVVG